MTQLKKISVLLHICMFIQLISSQLYEENPQNTLAYVGKSATLKCKIVNIANKVQVWSKYTSNGKGSIISQNGTIDPTYTTRFESSNGLYLTLKSAALSDSGKYGCRNQADVEGNSYFVYLVVFDNDPVLTQSPGNSTVLEGTLVAFTCQLKIQGTWFPIFKWTGTKSGIQLASTFQVGDTRTTTLQVKAGLKHNNEEFVCIVSFGPPTWSSGETNKDTSPIPYRKLVSSQSLTVIPLNNRTPGPNAGGSKAVGGSNAGTAIGIFIGFVIIGGLVVLGAFVGYTFYKKWKKKSKYAADSGDNAEGNSQNDSKMQRFKEVFSDMTGPVYQKFQNMRRKSSASTINDGNQQQNSIGMNQFEPSANNVEGGGGFDDGKDNSVYYNIGSSNDLGQGNSSNGRNMGYSVA